MRRRGALQIVDLVIGVVMIVYALLAHLVIPGVPFALLIVGGLLLIVEGWGGFHVRG